jgi:hypothetical protein
MAICGCRASRTDAIDGEVRGKSWHMLPFFAAVRGNQYPFGSQHPTTIELGRPNCPKGFAHFLDLRIGAQNPSRMAIIGQ